MASFRMPWNWVGVVSIVITGLVVEAGKRVAPASEAPGVAFTAADLEAEWVLQDRRRPLPEIPDRVRRQSGAISTKQDAAGGCDGIRDGTYGFHTDRENNPWWQVDLGQSQPLTKIVVYNRCDGDVADRAARLKVLLSQDSAEWTTCYQHDGKEFLGDADGKPLVIPVTGQSARLVRIQLPGSQYLHLDEIEVFGGAGNRNVALERPANQSSTSSWSTASVAQVKAETELSPPKYPTRKHIERGRELVQCLRRMGVETSSYETRLEAASETLSQLPADASPREGRKSYLTVRRTVREMSLANPLLDFDDLLFVKRVPGSFTHMSDQYYGWWSRPGGGLYILEDFKRKNPRLRCLSDQFSPGSFLRPDLSHDGRRVLFAYCKHYPHLSAEPDKLDKDNVPEDAFYHLFEMNLDGTGLKQLTFGKYDDFDGRYLPGGGIAFLSTRRGQNVQCGVNDLSADAQKALPDCYVRCGGGPERPVAVYTLHAMNPQRDEIRQISPFEMFEWTPSVDRTGRIIYARWDYVDRHNMPYMSLWSALPDGTNQQAVYGNMTRNPHCVFEPRRIPNSAKIVFTASGHHALTGGSLALLDPRSGNDGEEPIVRLTPEVAFPESEGWPQTYFANPYPLSENFFLVAWSGAPLPPGTPPPNWGMPGPPNDLGLYLFDAFGNLTLIYRDPAISSVTPIPVRQRSKPPQVTSSLDPSGPQVGTVLVQDVYRGLETISPGTIQRLRLVGLPVKTHPTMNHPRLGATRDDPGKFVLGTVPVEEDGSAHFLVPSGVPFFLQALDEEGRAVQTMRSATSVQPGQTFSCIGCHEPRNTAPVNRSPVAARRQPSPITPGPSGSWPLDFQTLVGPVLENACVDCHGPQGNGKDFDLTQDNAYRNLVNYGKPSLREHVLARYSAGRSQAGHGAAHTSGLLELLRKGHYQTQLSADDWTRLVTWMDTYAQRRGAFDAEQKMQLRDLRRRMAGILAEK